MENKRIGIVGGGQLGLLLTRAAIQFPASVAIYDPDPTCPAASYTQHFTQGKFDSYDDVLKFGNENDVIIFETESANSQALIDLEKSGKTVVSSPATLEWIQDKGLQKERLKNIGVLTSPFQLISGDDVKNYSGPFPIVQKWRKGGYDGYGVQILRSADDLAVAEEKDSVFEELVSIEKELSMILARSQSGEIVLYPPVEMVFDPDANLVDHLLAPAQISSDQVQEMEVICKKVAEELNFVGIYAIEFFLNKEGDIYVNEISPRPHNSGHHTIPGNVTSQYEQQIRIALGLPLGSTKQVHSCVLVNLLAENAQGDVQYIGLEEAFKIPNVQYTLYGKQKIRPYRKMGHAVIMETDLETAMGRMKAIRDTLRITTYDK